MKVYVYGMLSSLLAVTLIASPLLGQEKGKGKGKGKQRQEQKQTREGEPTKKVPESVSGQGRAAGELPPGLEQYKEKHDGKLPPGLQKQEEEGHLPPGLAKEHGKVGLGGEKAAKTAKKKPEKKGKATAQGIPASK